MNRKNVIINEKNDFYNEIDEKEWIESIITDIMKQRENNIYK